MDRAQALRVVVAAVKPHMDVLEGGPSPSVEEIAREAEKAFAEEPPFADAFDAMVKAIAIEARRGWMRVNVGGD